MLFEKSQKHSISLLKQLPKFLLSVTFLTFTITSAFAVNKSSGNKDKSGCGNNCNTQKLQVCQRVKGGKYILVKPATTALLNTYLSRGAVLAKNGFCPAEIVSSAIGDPCDFASNPTPATVTKNSGKSAGKNKGSKSSGKSAGKNKSKSGGGCNKNGKSGGKSGGHGGC